MAVKKRQTFQTRQYMLASDYEIYHYKDLTLKNVSIHHHDYFECLYFISGQVRYLIEGRVFDLKPGDIVLINTSELHQAAILDLTVPYERMVLWLKKDYVQRLSTADSNLADCFEAPTHKNIIRADLATSQRIKNLLSQIISQQDYTGFGHDLLTPACMTELLVLLNIEMLNIETRPTVEVRKSQMIEDVIDFINDHLDEPLRIDDLAEHFYLSKFHLSRQFSRQTGTTIHRYILQKKLILAKELILQHLSITDVYQQCGFGDYSNFFRAFRHEYSMTPKQFYEAMLQQKQV